MDGCEGSHQVEHWLGKRITGMTWGRKGETLLYLTLKNPILYDDFKLRPSNCSTLGELAQAWNAASSLAERALVGRLLIDLALFHNYHVRRPLHIHLALQLCIHF